MTPPRGSPTHDTTHDGHTIVTELVVDATAPSSMRELVRAAAAGSPRLEDAMLLASEIATNAILHGEHDGDQLLEVRIEHHDQSLFVSVTGPGAFRERVRGPDDPGGFGLSLVGRLSSRWGIDAGEHTTRVWYRIDW